MATPSVPAQKAIQDAKAQQGTSLINFPSDLGDIFMSFQFYDYRTLTKAPALSSNDGLVRNFFSADKANVDKDVQATKERFAQIHLPLPQQLTDQFAVSWQQTDLGIVGTLLSESLQGLDKIKNVPSSTQINNTVEQGLKDAGSVIGGLAGSSIESDVNTIGKWIGEGFNSTAGQASLAIAKMGMSQSLTGMIELSSGIQTNPNIAMLFQGPTLKAHQFSWKFAARSPEEANNIKKILGIFKRAMHPSRLNASTTGFLRYPSELVAEFHAPAKNFLFPLRPMVVEDVAINYTPNGIPSFFKDYKETSVEFTVRCRETSYYLRDSFDNQDEYGADGLQTKDLISNPPSEGDPGDVSN